MNDAPYRWFNFQLTLPTLLPHRIMNLRFTALPAAGRTAGCALMVWVPIGTDLWSGGGDGQLVGLWTRPNVFSVGAASVQDGKLEYYSSRGTDNGQPH